MAPVTALGEKSRNTARDRFLRSALLYLDQRRLGLREPEGHLHTSIHLHRRRELGTGLLILAELRIQRAKAPVAVRLEGAHPQCLGEGEGVAVVRLSLGSL